MDWILEMHSDFRCSRSLWSSAVAVLLAIAAAGLGGCHGGHRSPETAPSEPGPPWVSPGLREHPLSGRIWRTSDGRFIDAAQVVADLRAASYVLLGEKHDNADHHRVQAWLVDSLIARGRRPALAFEMLTTDRKGALASYLANEDADAAGLGEAVGWGETGWPDWALYRPIAQSALDSGAPILAAGLPRQTARAIAKKGVLALGVERVRTLGLDHPMPPKHTVMLRTEIIESHCDQLPESMIDPMVTVMTTQDALMAHTLVTGEEMAGRDGAVLIAGSGHARADHGVPWHLRRMAPGRSVTSVGLIEVESGMTEPAAYAAKFGGGRLPFDIVWFTPRADDRDPCDAYADQLERARRRHLE
jgi:uncharacterized iron-regulated protein